MTQKFTEDVFNEIKYFDIDNEINIEDIENIENWFENQLQIEPCKNFFNNIMEAIEFKQDSYIIDENENEKANICESVIGLLFHIKHQISLLDKNFWFASIFIMCLGCILIIKEELETLVLLAPVVSGYSIYYFYRGVQYNTSEIEAVCKYSVYEITLARTVIIILYNIVFVCLLSGANSIIRDTNLWITMIVTWLSPLLMTYCASLYFFYRNGIVVSILAHICIWTGYIWMYYKFNLNVLYSCNNLIWVDINLGLITISCTMLVFLLRNMRRVYI